jgi:hypothetical protein
MAAPDQKHLLLDLHGRRHPRTGRQVITQGLRHVADRLTVTTLPRVNLSVPSD